MNRFGAAEQAVEWDARYGQQEAALWSGRPNGRFVVEVEGSHPRSCPRCRMWRGRRRHLARRAGWTVSAIDISEVALSRARAAADVAGVDVEWIRGDALQTAFPAGSFDLVSMQYPALPKAAGEISVMTLLNTVRPGGVLLAIYHDLDHEHREHMKSRGNDPADYIDADELAHLLTDDFTVELHAVEPRIDPPPDSPHIADIILRARRR